MPGRVFHELEALWTARERQDEYIGTLVNAYLAGGGRAIGVKAGHAYVDVGTLNGYRAAIGLLSEVTAENGANVGRTALPWPAGRPMERQG
jgi:hypothetical protein